MSNTLYVYRFTDKEDGGYNLLMTDAPVGESLWGKTAQGDKQQGMYDANTDWGTVAVKAFAMFGIAGRSLGDLGTVLAEVGGQINWPKLFECADGSLQLIASKKLFD